MPTYTLSVPHCTTPNAATTAALHHFCPCCMRTHHHLPLVHGTFLLFAAVGYPHLHARILHFMVAQFHARCRHPTHPCHVPVGPFLSIHLHGQNTRIQNVTAARVRDGFLLLLTITTPVGGREQALVSGGNGRHISPRRRGRTCCYTVPRGRGGVDRCTVSLPHTTVTPTTGRDSLQIFLACLHYTGTLLPHSLYAPAARLLRHNIYIPARTPAFFGRTLHHFLRPFHLSSNLTCSL